MGEINDDNYWLEQRLTDEEIKVANDNHKKLCFSNKEIMTDQEYKDWVDFFD